MGQQNMHRMFEVIVDGGEHVFKTSRIARDEKDFRSVYGGNGEIVRIKDVTEDFPISENALRNALASKFGEAETEAIVYLLISGYANAIS